MKKILFTFMLLLWVAVGMAQTYINVGTLDELKNALKDPNAKIKLTADIDISSLKDANAPLCSTFAGIIDGSYTEQVGDSTVYCSHKIYGGINTYETVINEKGIEMKKVKFRDYTTYSHSPLFDKLNHATIKNVAFCNMYVSSNKSELGILASRAENHCTFKNVVMDYCDTYSKNDRAGVLLGYAEYSTFQFVTLNRCVVYVDGVEAGGLVGHSDYCTYELCTTSFDSGVFADGTDYYFGLGENAARGGGIVGYSVYDKFTGCINGAVVGTDQSQVGGIAGVSKYSTFTDCINVGIVTHITESSFNGLLHDRQRALDKLDLTPAELGWAVGGSVSGGMFLLNIIANMVSREYAQWMVSFMDKVFLDSCVDLNTLFDAQFGTFNWFGWESVHAEMITSVGEFVPFCLSSTIVLVAITVAIQVAFEIYAGDDEVGGISGLAQGGTFERCQNYGELKCKDDNLGGIVGLGQGVTINNCFNSGHFTPDEWDTTGTILGKAEPNENDNNKKCKVTNCLSTYAYHIVGDEDYDKGMDPASGNNYRPDGEQYNGVRVRCEEPVKRALINSGYVSWWLNQGIENRSIGAKPWRQGIAENTKNFNVMDPNHPEVEIKDLNPYEIGTPDELRYFATMAFFDKFAVGVLTADIDMTDQLWVMPIGAGEENSFRGIFDGQGHTISGIDFSTDADMGAALFGVVQAGADIRNVTVKDSKFSHANDYGAAGIVGRISIDGSWGNVVIENCANYADVYAKKNAGGILGRVYTGQDAGPNIRIYVENCYNMGTITAGDGDSGLLCGYTKDNGYVSNCWSGGKLKMSDPNYQYWPFSTVNDKNDRKIECLVGYNTEHHVKNCYIINPDVNVDHYNYRTDYALSLQDGVTIIDDTKLATGEYTYVLNGITNDVTKGLKWQQNLGTDEAPVPGNKGIYHARKVSNEYGTVCLPYPVKSDDKISYYTFVEVSEGDDIKLKFERVGEVLPGTPVLFRAAEAKDVASAESPVEVCFNSAGDGFYKYPNSPMYPMWDFLGTFEQKVFTGDEAKSIYYVSNGEIRNAAKTTIAPYRAYITGPSIDELTGNGTSQAKIHLVIEDEDGETTALQFIHSELAPSFSNTKTYSLLGTEVNDSYRGIVIRNGKKYINR